MSLSFMETTLLMTKEQEEVVVTDFDNGEFELGYFYGHNYKKILSTRLTLEELTELNEKLTKFLSPKPVMF